MKIKRVSLLALTIVPIICIGISTQFRLQSIGPLDIAYVKSKEYNKQNRHVEMAAAYTQLVKKYPERSDLFYPLGWANYKIGRIQEANTYMERYAQANPYHPTWQNHYIEVVRKASVNAL